MDAIMIRYSEQGLIEIPPAGEPEDWDAVAAEADERPTREGDLRGWGRWTGHYVLTVDGVTLHYAVDEGR